MIKQVDKHTVQLTGLDLFMHLQQKHNWSDQKTFDFMQENNQDVSFYDEYKQVKAEYKQAKAEKEKRLKRQRENLINGYSLTDPRVIAVSQSAEVTLEEAIELIIDEDWICLSDEEADERAEEYILDSVWAFNPSFLSYHTDIDEEIFKLLQDKCEGSNDAILRMIKDKDYFVEDAINSDGRGHFISFYDGEEHEQYVNNNFYYCYRIN
mgnify:FL=1